MSRISTAATHLYTTTVLGLTRSTEWINAYAAVLLNQDEGDAAYTAEGENQGTKGVIKSKRVIVLVHLR